MAKLAFIGLGVMGGPMAGHLAAAGHDVTVYNRTRLKADAWADRYGGRAVAAPAEAADGADAVVACVGNDDDVRAGTLGPTARSRRWRPGAVWIDHTTVSAELARELAIGGRDARAFSRSTHRSRAARRARKRASSRSCAAAATAAIDAAKPLPRHLLRARSSMIGEAGAAS